MPHLPRHTCMQYPCCRQHHSGCSHQRPEEIQVAVSAVCDCICLRHIRLHVSGCECVWSNLFARANRVSAHVCLSICLSVASCSARSTTWPYTWWLFRRHRTRRSDNDRTPSASSTRSVTGDFQRSPITRNNGHPLARCGCRRSPTSWAEQDRVVGLRVWCSWIATHSFASETAPVRWSPSSAWTARTATGCSQTWSLISYQRFRKFLEWISLIMLACCVLRQPHCFPS